MIDLRLVIQLHRNAPFLLHQFLDLEGLLGLRSVLYARAVLRPQSRRRPLSNDREEALHFFPQVRDGLAIAREMPQQASLEKSIKQRIKGAPGDERLSATK